MSTTQSASSPNHRSSRRALRGLALAALSLGLAASTFAADFGMQDDDHARLHGAHESGRSPLIGKVREATQRFRDINVALGEGWVQATPCVSGPNEGAMGVHFIQPSRLHDAALKAEEPEMLIYEPMHGGEYRLVGVEYLVLASEWAAQHPGVPPSVDGHLTNFVGEPNRYALPAFYEMHVWAWEDNPNGSFSDWHSRVTCARQASTGS